MTLTHTSATTLLEKFYNGQTTLSEERLLHSYLTADDCPEDLLADRQVFLSLAAMDRVDIPEGLASRMAAGLDAHTRKRRIRTLRRRMLPIGVAAAVAALLIAIPLLHHPAPSVYKDTCSSPREAAVEVQQALDCVSTSLAMGFTTDEDELGPPCP